MTNKCSAPEKRKNMLVAETLARTGVDFVAIPVLSEEHKKELLKLLDGNLLKLLERSE